MEVTVPPRLRVGDAEGKAVQRISHGVGRAIRCLSSCERSVCGMYIYTPPSVVGEPKLRSPLKMHTMHPSVTTRELEPPQAQGGWLFRWSLAIEGEKVRLCEQSRERLQCTRHDQLGNLRSQTPGCVRAYWKCYWNRSRPAPQVPLASGGTTRVIIGTSIRPLSNIFL